MSRYCRCSKMWQISIKAEIVTIAGEGLLVDQRTKTLIRKLRNGPVVPLLMAGGGTARRCIGRPNLQHL